MMTVTFTEQVRWEVLAKYRRSPSGSVPSPAEAATGQETDPGGLTASQQWGCGSAPVSRLPLTLQVSWSETFLSPRGAYRGAFPTSPLREVPIRAERTSRARSSPFSGFCPLKTVFWSCPHSAQLTSLRVPKCFSRAPTAEMAKTQYKQTKGEVPALGKPEGSGVGGTFLGGRGEVEGFGKDSQPIPWGPRAVSIMWQVSGNKRPAIRNTPTKMHL